MVVDKAVEQHQPIPINRVQQANPINRVEEKKIEIVKPKQEINLLDL